MLRKIVHAILIAILINYSADAQTTAKITPKREFRGVWVATVSNIDWPSKPGLTSDQQKQEFIGLLEQHKANGMNAIILQVRPASDAFYAKSREPWSRWLMGKQGVAPAPDTTRLNLPLRRLILEGWNCMPGLILTVQR